MSIIELLIILFGLLFLLLFIVVIWFWQKSTIPNNKYEIYFSGGADIETGKIVINTNYFKGIPVRNIENGNPRTNRIKVLITNLNDGTTENSFISKKMTIGRYNTDYIVYNDNKVSKTHCILFVYVQNLYIQDNSSSNKTYLNENEIGNKPHRIVSGDIIRVGNTKLRIEF